MSNNKQQTTVDWIEQEMLKGNLSLKEILIQAREMEMERMIEFGCLLTFESKHIIEDCYNEIYGGNK
jgi:hypothetical protein